MKKILIFLFLLQNIAAFAQNETDVAALDAKPKGELAPAAHRQATEADWSKARAGIDFSGLKKDKPEKPKKEDNDNTPKRNYNFDESWLTGLFKGMSVLGKVLLFGVVIALVAGLMWLLVRNDLFVANKKIQHDFNEFDLNDIENNLHESDLDRFLRQAVEGGNYRAAIRIYYLAILKEYSLKELIHWKKDKTNYEYLREVRRADQASQTLTYNDFRDVTTLFDRVWYGEREIQKADYEAISPSFYQLLRRLQSGGN